MEMCIGSGGYYFEPVDNINIITEANIEIALKTTDFFIMQFYPLPFYLKSSIMYCF